MTEPVKPPYHPRLMCRLAAYEVDLMKHHITLRLASGHCCDMTGAIRFATRHDSLVRRIITMSGDQPSTTFERRGDGWGATGPLSIATTIGEDK